IPKTRLRSRRDERTFPASLLTRQANSTEDLAPESQSNTTPSSSTETLANVPRDATNSTITYSGQT
ncbi:hypothetical protein BD560DRAFT_401164, partial [Blakeslea trispora]